MGIAINLMVIPQRILPDRWKQVYEESLRLLQAYDFMDSFPARRGGLEYRYAGKSRDRENFPGTEYRGWRTIGSMRTGEKTEEYILFGDIRAYLVPEDAAGNGEDDEKKAIPEAIPEDIPEYILKDAPEDILTDILDEAGLAAKRGRCRNLWGGSTEGGDSHIYLLAIACLFASRFPDAVMVTGSISAGQCRRAVRWANRYLDEPVCMPDNGCMDRLLGRLGRTSISRECMLGAFFKLTIEAKDSKMGKFLKTAFTDKEISSYYKQRLTGFRPDRRGFVSVLKEYLEMGFSFEELCRIAAADADGPGMVPEDFLEHILALRLHIEKKETGDFTKLSVNEADSERVDTAEEETARIIGMFLGAANRNVNAFYPLDKIRRDCKKVFGNRCDVDSVTEGILLKAEKDSSERAGLQSLLYDAPDSIFREMLERAAGKRRERQYDINSYRELGGFTPGCSIRPELEADLLKNFLALHEYAEKEFGTFQKSGRMERENYFIIHSERLLLRRDVWDRIFERVMDDKYIIRIYGLFGVDCKRKEGYLFCRSLFTSLEAIDFFWERTMDEIQGSGRDI